VPTVLRFEGFRVAIYPNDHHPAHVHLIGPGAEAVFDLECPDGPPRLREVWGLSRAEAARPAARLTREIRLLCGKWSEIHGRA
jgi:hypothetical protein